MVTLFARLQLMYPGLPDPSGTMLEATFGDIYPDEDSAWARQKKAVDWCEQRVKASEWVVERCGNLYTELQVPKNTPLADMQKLATKYVREFHPDKVNRLANISKDVKDAWVSDHSARVSSMRECFTDAVTRFFYDRALNTKTAAVPIFRHMTPNVPRLATAAGVVGPSAKRRGDPGA